MITVIINQFKDIKNYSKNKILINDNDFYNIFNGQKFFDNTYDIEKLKELINDIKEYSINNDIVIHTFNPLILNFFDDSDKDIFYYYDSIKIGLYKFFDNFHTLKKLEVLGIGEVICDTRISDLSYI